MAKVDIIKMGHAFHKGQRGEKEGGAPSKDSIWGIAFVGGSLVKFFGRRGGKMRFKSEKKADLPAAIEQFTNEKLSGFPFGKKLDCRYTEVAPANFNELVPDLETEISKHYYAALKEKKVNNRSTAKPAPKAADETPAPKAARKPKAATETSGTGKAKATRKPKAPAAEKTEGEAAPA